MVAKLLSLVMLVLGTNKHSSLNPTCSPPFMQDAAHAARAVLGKKHTALARLNLTGNSPSMQDAANVQQGGQGGAQPAVAVLGMNTLTSSASLHLL